MTIFQHTIDKVLSGEKTYTSRIWKDDWIVGTQYVQNGSELFDSVISKNAWEKGKIRRLYYVGQILSVQPARGAKGVAKIKVLGLQKRDVRDYGMADIAAEGFATNPDGFYGLWCEMHDKPAYHAYLRTDLGFRDFFAARPAERYTALFIRFVLLENKP